MTASAPHLSVPQPNLEACVTVFAPYGQDASLLAKVLHEAGTEPLAVQDMAAFCAAIGKCAAGLLTTDPLTPEAVGQLRAALRAQPPWSDMPLILLANRIDPASYSLLAGALGNVTIVERPLDPASLLTLVKAALRARARQYQVRDLLRESEAQSDQIQALNERLFLALDAAAMGVWEWDPATDLVTWENDRICEIIGCAPSAGPVTASRFVAEYLYADDAPRFERAVTATVETGLPFQFKGRFHRADGQLRWIEFTGHLLVSAPGVSLRVVGTAADITERKLAELALEEHATEIQALNVRLKRSMTETHHRVKNNLQVISAMIDMQALEHWEEKAIPIEDYRQLKAHVHTLAIVHDLLTKDVKEEEEAQRISARAVLSRLLPMLQQTALNKVVHYSIEDVSLTSKLCISLALILNELVTNALKHGHEAADIAFRVEGTQGILEVCDDGPGFPEGFNPMKAANMGLELVESLVRGDLKGQSVYGNRPGGGGRVVVTFPRPPDEVPTASPSFQEVTAP
jgi:PAS domain S-box-containing protein